MLELPLATALVGLASIGFAESPPSITWTRGISSPADDKLNAIAVDNQENVIVGGHTTGNLFRTRVGLRDGYLVSFNSAGDQRWAAQFGSQQRYIDVDDVTLGPNGDWFITGSADYRRGSTHYGGTDVFVQRVSQAGRLGFVTQLGTSGTDYAQAITASNTHVFPVGDTYGSLSGTNAGGNDAFLARYRVTTNLTLESDWLAQKGTNDWDTVYDAAYGGNRVFVAGETFGNFNGPNIEFTDAFLMSFDTEGNFQWARQYGQSDEPEIGYAVATNGVDAVYIAGLTFLEESWQTGGAPDAFLAKYDMDGNFQWDRHFQTSVWDVFTALDVDAAGNVYVGGYTGQQSFTPSESDALVMKYTPSGDLVWMSEYDLGVDERMSGLEVSPAGDKIWIAGMDWVDGPILPLADGFVALLEHETIDGDFNHDGNVDAADYVVWRKSNGTEQQYIAWRSNFGITPGTIEALAKMVPEPRPCHLLFVLAFGAMFCRCHAFGWNVYRCRMAVVSSRA